MRLLNLWILNSENTFYITFVYSGTIVFLWHSLFEGALTGILDVLKRVSDMASYSTVHLEWCHVSY